MCGIAGIYIFSDNPETFKRKRFSTLVPKMLEAIHYRGDGQGGWNNYGKAAVGMVRLPIINENEDDIPYTNEDGSIIMVHNGQFFNHEDIHNSLKNEHQFKSKTDTELFVHAYEEFGINVINRLNGMYSFALYDSNKDELHLVRDKAGEKFLYYYEDAEMVVFGSEIKAILQVVKPEIGHAFSYELFEACFGEETLFKKIKLIEPGHYIKFRGKEKSNVHYWNVFDNLIEVKDDERKIENDLTDLIVDAIEVRTKNTRYPYGVLVSGGIDSGLIASIAKPEYVYSCTYDGLGPDFSEINYALDIAKHIGKKLEIVRPTKDDFLLFREKIAYHLDTPCTWTSFNLFMIFKRVAEDTKVVLTGEGMDEMFGGYHRYHLLFHDEQIHKIGALMNYSYLIKKYYGDPAERYARIINRSELIFQKKYSDYMRSFIDPYFDKFKGNVVHAMGAVDFYSTLQIILQMSDRMSMAHTIENRSPFLDHRLIQYAFSMPQKYKIHNGITKYIIKKIASKFLPASVVKRTDKRGFLLPFNVWFPTSGEKYDRSAYKKMVYQDWKKVFFNNLNRG